MVNLAQPEVVRRDLAQSPVKPEGFGLGPRLHVLIFVASCLILISRRPDLILRPEFFAEDGTILYASAYNGARSFSLVNGGYLHIAGQVVAYLAQFVPFVMAPLVMAGAAIAARVLPVSLFLSSRFRFVGNLWFRALLCAGYLALPNTYELYGNIATLQWHLALLACMVVLATPSAKLGWRLFDIAVLLALSVESPTAFLLVPIVLFLWWRERTPWTLFQALALVPGSVVQFVLVLASSQHRSPAPLGATFPRFFQIVARQVFLSSLLGMRAFASKMTRDWYTTFCVAICVVCFFAMAYAAFKGPIRLRLFIVFAVLITAVSMARPLASLDEPQWMVMRNPGMCCRYWEIPMLAFLGSLVWIAGTRKPLSYAAIAALLLLPSGISHDWRYFHYPDEHFADHARQFSQAPPGTVMTIPIDPPGWNMILRKH
jgi:hypothetical protein